MTHNFLYRGFLYWGGLCQPRSFAALGKAPISCVRLYCSRPRNARHGCQFGMADYQGAKLVQMQPRRKNL